MRIGISIRAAALAAGLAVAGAGCGAVRPYAAVVNGERISQRQLHDELQDLSRNPGYVKAIEARSRVHGEGRGTFDAAFTAQVLTRRIYYTLVDEELHRRHLRITPADLSAARARVVSELTSEQLLGAFPKPYQATLVHRSAAFDVLASALAGQGRDEGAVRAYYDAHQGDFETACVAHILVPTREAADALGARLAKGEDFAAVAKAESKDPQSAPRGGELGCDITRQSSLVPEFVNAVFSQPVGQVGPPVQSPFGFHLIKVTSRTLPPYDQAAAQVRQRLADANGERLVEWLSTAVGKAKITVNPTYGRFDRRGSPRVLPPQAPPAPTAPGSPTPPPDEP